MKIISAVCLVIEALIGLLICLLVASGLFSEFINCCFMGFILFIFILMAATTIATNRVEEKEESKSA